jgi:hypothetical protein
MLTLLVFLSVILLVNSFAMGSRGGMGMRIVRAGNNHNSFKKTREIKKKGTRKVEMPISGENDSTTYKKTCDVEPPMHYETTVLESLVSLAFVLFIPFLIIKICLLKNTPFGTEI